MSTIADVRVRRPTGQLGAATALLALAAVTGVAAAAKPSYGILVGGGFVFLLVVLWNLSYGICLFLLVTFLDSVSNNQNLSVTKAAGAILAASWLATATSNRIRDRNFSLQQPALAAALAAFLAWNVMSYFWAQSHSAVDRSVERYALDILLVPIVFWAVRERRHVLWIFSVFVVGALLSVGYGVTHSKVSGTAAAAQVGRLAGANVEANVLATLLMVSTVFAVALFLVFDGRRVARPLAGLAVVAGLAAFFGTFSRGGIISFLVVVLAGCVYGGRARRAFVSLVIVGALVGVVLIGANGSGTVSRLTSNSTSGRSSIWTVGWRMVEAHPVIGVGSGNYTVVEPNYLSSAPGAIARGDLIVVTPLPAHNIYLHILAEMGVVGLVLFLAVVMLALRAAVRAVRLFEVRGDRALEVLGRTLVVALIGILAADFFVSDQYSKQLWLLLGMGPALLAIAQRQPPGQRADAGPEPTDAASVGAGEVSAMR